jgi:DNA helicase-2/ATP-dependent DNA helicase PcrA
MVKLRVRCDHIGSKTMNLDKLNPEQYKAATTIHGPLLIIAGAGSGKTGVITHRIAYMLEEGIAQSHILALTFTNKAANEMSERVKDLTKKKLSNLMVSTFHSFGLQILKEQCHLLHYRPNFTIYDTQDQQEIIKEAGRELNMIFEFDEIKEIQKTFSQIKSRTTFWNEHNMMYKQLFQEYEDFLSLKNAFDFDDLILKPIVLFEQYPNILVTYQQRYQYILVDEFQDTSLLQYRFLALLGGQHRNVCVVGDDDQSIYSWRGANYENLLNFEKDFPEKLEIRLERNYRSTGSILKAANAVIAHNSNRKEKELWTEQKHNEAALQVRYLEDDDAENEFVCGTIRSLVASEDRTLDSFGILVRTNSLMRGLEEALLRHSLAYSISGGSSFFDRKEIKDIIAYLKIIDNADDDISLLRIINTPRRGIGKQTLQIIKDYAHSNHYSVYSSITSLSHSQDSPLSETVKDNLRDLLTLIEQTRELMQRPKQMAAHARDFLDQLDYWSYLVNEYKENEKFAKWRYDNIQTFFNFFERWEKNPDNIDPKLNTYLNRITLNSRDEDDVEQKNKVSLMTIHAAKGLEFDVAFIVGVEDGIIPHARSIAENSDNLQEERRLFYVALTRAREKLFMTVCQKRRTMKETVDCQPSPFLNEIPGDLIELEDIPETEENLDHIASNIFSKFK